MTFKELFTKVDEANTILRPMCEREITVTVEFDGTGNVEFKNYDQFIFWVDRIFSLWFSHLIYDLDLGQLKPLTRVTLDDDHLLSPFEIVVMLNVCDIK